MYVQFLHLLKIIFSENVEFISLDNMGFYDPTVLQNL